MNGSQIARCRPRDSRFLCSCGPIGPMCPNQPWHIVVLVFVQNLYNLGEASTKTNNTHTKHLEIVAEKLSLFHCSTSQLSYGLVTFHCFLEFLGVPWAEISSMEMMEIILPWFCQIHDTRVNGDPHENQHVPWKNLKNSGWKTTFLLKWPLF